jgi:hypothetical protein
MDQPPEKKDFNLENILLPKKEVRTPASAERVNAGVLLEGEAAAELPKAEAAPIVPAAQKEGPADTPIAPLQTYQTDVESVITQKNISGVDIVTAESERAGKRGGLFTFPEKGIDMGKLKKVSTLLCSLALVIGAAALLYFVFLRPAPTSPGQVTAVAPFIGVDETQVLVLTPEQVKRSVMMGNLVSLKNKTGVSLGLISRIYVTSSSSTVKDVLPPQLDVQSLLSTLGPNTSSDFLPTLDPTYYILGVHVYDGNQPFLILRVDSYEQAFSGMLAWERTMPQELAPLFTRTPRPKLPGEVVPEATSTVPSITSTQFQDKIVENHDARVITNAQGDILLLWTFLDRNTLVIATNDATLRELISRRSSFISEK